MKMAQGCRQCNEQGKYPTLDMVKQHSIQMESVVEPSEGVQLYFALYLTLTDKSNKDAHILFATDI